MELIRNEKVAENTVEIEFKVPAEEFEAAGLTVEWKTDDLHNSPYAEGNVMTEYESNFTAKGMPIHAALVRF